MWNVSGTSGAAPVWAALMARLHANAPSRAPRAPEGLARVDTRFDSSIEAPRAEWFLRGTEQARFALEGTDPGVPALRRGSRTVAARAGALPDGAASAQRITAPAPGTIVALDPDIPPQRQRLHFNASHPSARWRLDGKPLGQGERVAWLPWPGRHVVQLVDAQGQVMDEIRIEVRGAGVKTTMVSPGDRVRLRP
jgi:penicillin-binding protein 1C